MAAMVDLQSSHVVQFVKSHDPGPTSQRFNQVYRWPPKFSTSPHSRGHLQFHMKQHKLLRPPPVPP